MLAGIERSVLRAERAYWIGFMITDVTLRNIKAKQNATGSCIQIRPALDTETRQIDRVQTCEVDT